MGKVDLYTVVEKIDHFSEETSRFFFKQILSALHHCHQHKFAHCDLKLENIIFDNQGNTKLIDFGLAHHVKHLGVAKYSHLLGTYGYMAPEVHQSAYYDIMKTDLFSLGVILFVMVYGSPPFTTAVSEDNHF